MLRTSANRFRIVGLLEGTSFLVLLGVAMPLKYLAGMPSAVMWVGWAHGLLFVLYLFALLDVAIANRWSLWLLIAGGMASVLPFGPFVFDRSAAKRAAAANTQTAGIDEASATSPSEA